MFLHLYGQAQVLYGAQQGSGQAVIRFEHRACHARLVGGSGYGVGQLVGVQDGAAPCQTAYHVPAVRAQTGHVRVGEGLGMPEREAGRVSGIQAQGREGLAAVDVFEDGFIQGHVPGPGAGGGRSRRQAGE